MIKKLIFSTLMLIGVNCFAEPTHDANCGCTVASGATTQTCSCTECQPTPSDIYDTNKVTGSCSPGVNAFGNMKISFHCTAGYTPTDAETKASGDASCDGFQAGQPASGLPNNRAAAERAACASLPPPLYRSVGRPPSPPERPDENAE